jgi:exoribonuclease R
MIVRRISAPDLDFGELRRELGFRTEFSAAVLEEAETVAESPRLPEADFTDIPFVTVDPTGARDLDQAMHLSTGPNGGYRVRYAIADVSAFVVPGSLLDLEVRRRGLTYYFPDTRVPLHPLVLGEKAASLLPGVERPAVVWTIDLDSEGMPVGVEVGRARIRSRAQLDYPGVQAAIDEGTPPEPLAHLKRIGELRQARARDRGAVDLRLPEQEVVQDLDHGWRLALRAPLPVEDFNAQISLLTGMCAARLMLDGGIGLLRTLPPAPSRIVEELRAGAVALGLDLPPVGSPGDLVAAVDAGTPHGAAFLELAVTLLRGAGYTCFDGEKPAQPLHAAVAAEYAHVTAPLRRLADRYTTEVCLALCAGVEVPGWAREALSGLPRVMEAAERKSRTTERAVIDLAEVYLLRDRVGEVFDAVVVDARVGRGEVILADPPVRARCAGRLELGATARVRLTEADLGRRDINFEVEVGQRSENGSELEPDTDTKPDLKPDTDTKPDLKPDTDAALDGENEPEPGA